MNRQNKLSRRQFLKVGVLAGAGLFVPWRVSSRTHWKVSVSRTLAAIPGDSLDPADIPKYATPLLIPPAMPKAGEIKAKGGGTIDYYEIAVRQFQQQILPAPLPATTVWGYGPKVAQKGQAIFHAPSLTIEARSNTPVRVKWMNELVDDDGNYLPHLLPVDPTLHWANPPAGVLGRDMRPDFTAMGTPGRYTGPVPLVTHVHGAVGVGDESDGYAEAWYLPAAKNIPAGYATEGTWYNHFKNKASKKFGASWSPGSATFQYPNSQRASTIWYHDHALGMTRLNVYAGPAGFYIIRGGASDQVRDQRTGKKAVLPGPAPALGDAPGTTYYEIPIAIQDRSFNADGSLFYPSSREFFDGATEYIPSTDLSPIWNPEFFGNTIMVNGNTWPFLSVEQRRYRFRFLNGCQSRFLILDFNNIPGVEVWAIGNEGGFLAAPVNITADHGNRLLMALAERADLIVDFTNVQPGNYVLGNVGPDEPFGGGEPPDDFDSADPATTGRVMEFRVTPAVGLDPSTPPQFLTLPAITPLPAPTTTRPLALMEEMSKHWNGPAEARLGNVDMGMAMPMMWSDTVTENPKVGDTEVWEFYNFTADAHPMHVHEVAFEVVDRQTITFDEEMGHVTNIQLIGSARPPEPWESGFKDTVIAYPSEVTRVRMKFDNPGLFVWHCHIVEHEDNEMMRPYFIGSNPPTP
jgi:spore coat protein A, manganese oxidase